MRRREILTDEDSEQQSTHPPLLPVTLLQSSIYFKMSDEEGSPSPEHELSYEWSSNAKCTKVTRISIDQSTQSRSSEQYSVGTPVFVETWEGIQPGIIMEISKLQEAETTQSGKEKKEEKEEAQTEGRNPGDSPFMMRVRWFSWPQLVLDEHEETSMGQAVRKVSRGRR